MARRWLRFLLWQVLLGSLSADRDDPSVPLLYQSLRQTPVGSSVACLYSCRAHLWSHRQSLSPERIRSFSELIAFVASNRTDYVLWETQPNLINNVLGQVQAELLPDLQLWLKRSTLFETSFENEAGIVSRFRGSNEEYLRAFEFYRQSFLASDPSERAGLLEKCLQIVPDFPDARVLWASTVADSGAAPAKAVESALTEHLRQYPHDFATTFYTIALLMERGRRDLAVPIAVRAEAEAKRLGRAREQAELTRYLYSDQASQRR